MKKQISQSSQRVSYDWEPDLVSDDQLIWRYMDIDKFLHLLQENSLYMAPMRQFIDTYEGTFTKSTIDMFYNHLNSQGISTLKNQNKKHVDEIFVGCWHINDRESITMWDAYTSSRHSVVIETTVKQLRNALNHGLSSITSPVNTVLEECGLPPNNHISNRYSIKIGKVNYIDETYVMSSYNSYETIFSKRMCYKFENELRAVIHRGLNPSIIAAGVNSGDKLPNWDINVSNLLKSVRIHPKGGAIFEAQIKTLLENLKLNTPVSCSAIK